jgi:hypothetical protein
MLFLGNVGLASVGFWGSLPAGVIVMILAGSATTPAATKLIVVKPDAPVTFSGQREVVVTPDPPAETFSGVRVDPDPVETFSGQRETVVVTPDPVETISGTRETAPKPKGSKKNK